MSTCTRDSSPRTLDLPEDFEDLTGVLSVDLRVIVGALTRRAGERMLLSPRQRQEFQRTLWDNLTRVIEESLEPLNIERR
jgi:hypothetical protein